MVSVPLRGKGRDQRRNTHLLAIAPTKSVSVPLRGKGRDQHAALRGLPVERFPAFPSPCGEKVGINSCIVEGVPMLWWAFPSPCGEKVGINADYLNPRDFE